MGLILNFPGELKDDSLRHIIFNCSGAIDFIETVTVELSNTPKEGFIEIHPAVLYEKMYLPHMGKMMILNFLRLLSYAHHSFDKTNHPEYKVYYKCVNHFHHSHDMFTNRNDKYKPMTIEEGMEYVKKNQFDLEPNDYTISEDFKTYLEIYIRGFKVKELKNKIEL